MQADLKIIYWLRLGIIMIIIQVMLGGITRITESGLSITEWKPLSGATLPFTQEAWQQEFEKYQTTDQYLHLKSYMNLEEFKFIFFWEWLHRNWARLIGLVFLLPFIYFLVKKIIPFRQSASYWGLLALGAFQGFMGWVMVKSGLKKGNLFVEHTFLTIHFVLALATLCYILFLLHKKQQQIILVKAKTKNRVTLLLVFTALQLIYGAFMSGLRAAPFASSWPTINGEWFPDSLWKNIGLLNFLYNPFMVHFVHRGLAYILMLLSLYIFVYIKKNKQQELFKWNILLLVLLFIQMTLGITTVWTALDYTLMRWFAILHQMIGLLFFMTLVWISFTLKLDIKK